MQRFNHKKGVQAANYFAARSGGPFSKKFICKLIWMADRLHLRAEGRTITGDNYSALEHGPVPSKTLDIINQKPGRVSAKEVAYRDEFIEFAGGYIGLIQSIKEPNLRVFSQTDRDVMNYVFEQFGNSKLREVIDFSHKYPEWKRHEMDINDPHKRDAYPVVEEDFFLPTESNDDFFATDLEGLNLIKELFLEHEKIYRSFAN